MKDRMYVDIGAILDEVFEAARDFGEKMGKEFGTGTHGPMGPGGPDGPLGGPGGPRARTWFDMGQDNNADYYPGYSYPPMNIYLTQDRSMVFEFALSGFDEKDIQLSFQGDYMVFSAKIGTESAVDEGVRYVKRRLKLKDVERQKYYVPADKFAQEMVKAVFRNGILKVTVPPKEDSASPEGIKIEIIREGQ
ncbi:MAG TPA: Hsp20/alpha crystallin family protein [Rectinemataceae bacterium]|nr:Hsp20/alpha crystallin family protein [Rectinemataceae bacterium]